MRWSMVLIFVQPSLLLLRALPSVGVAILTSLELISWFTSFHLTIFSSFYFRSVFTFSLSLYFLYFLFFFHLYFHFPFTHCYSSLFLLILYFLLHSASLTFTFLFLSHRTLSPHFLPHILLFLFPVSCFLYIHFSSVSCLCSFPFLALPFSYIPFLFFFTLLSLMACKPLVAPKTRIVDSSCQ